MNTQSPPGKGQATASLELGIISVALWFFGYTSFISVILGIVGVIMAVMAKKQGYDDGVRMAGLILSIIGVIGGAIFFVACVACAACAAVGGAVGSVGRM